MATPSGRKGARLSDLLLREPYRFDFFQAIQLLERLSDERAAANPRARRYPIGQDRSPEREVVRFGALASLGFPAGPISKLTVLPDDEEAPAPRPHFQMTVSFMGMTGPSGVLPQHYTRLILERQRDKDFALRQFLDLFNHRAISLFYRAWEKYRFPTAYARLQRGDTPQGEDLFTSCLYALVGLGTPGLRQRLGFDDEAVLFYAGLFAHEGRCTVSLQRMLEEFFELPVEVVQFQGQWMYLSDDDRSQMPSRGTPLGRNNQLGVSLVAGERVWDVQSKFRLRLGPLSYTEFLRFTPRGDGLRVLLEMTRLYSGPEFDFDVQPVLRADEVPWLQLTRDTQHAPRMGWNTWLRSRPFQRDVDDAIFSIPDV